MKVLIIGQVWPEPNSSAAGSRLMQLIEAFQQQHWELHFASVSSRTDFSIDLEAMGIHTHLVAMNDVSFDAFAKALQPDLVLFDRFMVEEQFGWRITENCPYALKMLDTIDIHGLRKGREQALKANHDFTEKDLVNDYAKREIASIYRCDLSLIISKAEIEILTGFYGVPKRLLLYVPFMVDAITETTVKNWKPFEQRIDFMTIGMFRHLPNWDAVLYLKQTIWPLIRKRLPEANLHIYGSYATQKVDQLHNPKDGFLIAGRAASAQEVIAHSKILLAPLRIGAGLKGKLLDALETGTPTVTTTVGAEGMQNNFPWNGAVTDDPETFAAAAIKLYTDKNLWEEVQKNCVDLINKQFLKTEWFPLFIYAIKTCQGHLQEHRLRNFTGAMLQHQSLQASKFMSKWIEEKNK